MFTGIVFGMAEVVGIRDQGTNKELTLQAQFPDSIQVDQSIAHNGVCLTVTDTKVQEEGLAYRYRVTAVEETLKKSNLGDLAIGDKVNLELCMKVGDRLDGHFVQGHVDDTGTVTAIENRDGSWNYTFSLDTQWQHLLVDKGSICINGVSLTVVHTQGDSFGVTIIPYTFSHTTFQFLKVGDRVNLEFDILGKYLAKLYKR